MSRSSPIAVDGRTHQRLVGLAALLGAAFLFAYYDVVTLLVSQWSGNDVYSYGFLIPVMSVFLIWTRRQALIEAVGAPSLGLGVPVMLAALFALHLGRVGSFGILAEVSLPLALAGAVLLTAGRRALGVLWLPIAYLLFAVPIWDVFTDRLHEPFQLLSATIGQGIMRLAGVPSLRTGTLLQLPSVSLEVARACSGVNYLISVVVIAIPYAYLTVSSNLRRAAVGVFAVAVAILSNGLRVALIGILQFYGFSDAADLHGPAHTLQGMFVAIVGYAALFLGARVLEDRHGEGAREPVVKRHAVSVSTTALASVAVVLAAAGLLRPFAHTVPVELRGSLTLPATVGEWRAQGGAGGEERTRWAAADRAASTTYWTSAGSVRVYVGYVASQGAAKKLVGHGGPTLPSRTGSLAIRLADGTEFQAGECDLPPETNGQRSATLVYWYDVAGSPSASAIGVKWLTVWHSLVRRQSNGAVVVLEMQPGTAAGPDTVRATLQAFAAQIVPHIRRSLSPGTGAE